MHSVGESTNFINLEVVYMIYCWIFNFLSFVLGGIVKHNISIKVTKMMQSYKATKCDQYFYVLQVSSSHTNTSFQLYTCANNDGCRLHTIDRTNSVLLQHVIRQKLTILLYAQLLSFNAYLLLCLWHLIPSKRQWRISWL